MKYWIFFLSTFIYSQTLVLEDSLYASSKVYDFQIDLNNSIYYINELQNNLYKIDYLTKKEIKSKYYSNVAQLNLTNPFFISFIDENFNQIHFLDKELFETQIPYDLIKSDELTFVKNNMELFSYSSSLQELCKVSYRKISNQKICKLYSFLNTQDVLMNDDFLILISENVIQINNLKQNSSSIIKLKKASKIKLILNELFYVEDHILYSLNLFNTNKIKKWMKIYPKQNYALNNDFLVVENTKVFYFYKIK